MKNANYSKSQTANPVEINGNMVRVSTATNIPAVLQEFWCDMASILRKAGFSHTFFENPDTEVDYLAGSKLLSCCVVATGCEHFGLLVGMRASASNLGIPGFMLKSASNLGEALESFVRYHSFQDQGGIPIITKNKKHIFWGYELLDKRIEVTEHIYDITTTTICNVMRSMLGPDWRPAQVHFSRNQPNNVEPYKHFFKAPILFNQEQNGILFSAEYCDHPISTADAHLFQYLEKEAQNRQVQVPDGILATLRRKIAASLPRKSCSVESIASELGIHKRTLHRKLREEGSSFQQEVGIIRYKMARKLLSQKKTNS